MGQLEETQWLAPDDLAARQREQLRLLSRHCAKHSGQYARRLAEAGLTPDDVAEPGGLQRLPLLTRRDLQTATDFSCREVPPGHLPLAEKRSSGSTGEPTKVTRTAVDQVFWQALTMRDFLWHGNDFSKRLFAVRHHATGYTALKSWGHPPSLLFSTGPSVMVPNTSDIAQVFDWVLEFQPDTLVLHPAILDGLIDVCRKRRTTIGSIRHIHTLGDTLLPHVREAADAQFGATISDIYSAEEMGYIALQCPVSGLYHTLESVVVEVLNESGRDCRVGEMGRLSVTSPHNFSMPLIRYDIGDYAEAGPPCPCGRGLPTLKRIVGRERNLCLFPDGARRRPLMGHHFSRDVVPVNQYQLIQHDRERIEVRLVVERPLSQQEEERFRTVIQNALGYPFRLDFHYFAERLPIGATGKFEDFICKAT